MNNMYKQNNKKRITRRDYEDFHEYHIGVNENDERRN